VERPACLDGSLDDLSIQDVLQILALGRKSGYLELETGVGVGAVVFRRGRVVASVYEGDGGPVPGPDVPSFSGGEREGRIRARITAFFHRLARCRKGTFTFVTSGPSPRVLLGRDPSREALGVGIDVVDLLIEMACRLEGGELQEALPPPGADLSVLLVDDEEQVRGLLSRYLVEGGYRVVEASDVDSAVRSGKSLAAEGVRFVVVTDLYMRGANGSSVRGGIEVIKRLAGLRLRPPVVMMADSESWSLTARTIQRVSSVVFKPCLSRLDPEEFEADLKALAGRIVQEVLPRVCGSLPA